MVVCYYNCVKRSQSQLEYWSVFIYQIFHCCIQRSRMKIRHITNHRPSLRTYPNVVLDFLQIFLMKDYKLIGSCRARQINNSPGMPPEFWVHFLTTNTANAAPKVATKTGSTLSSTILAASAYQRFVCF